MTKRFRSIARRNAIEISRPQLTHSADNVCRVDCPIGADKVFYESDFPLVASPEAFATAFVLPAMSARATLAVEGSVCPVWRANLDQSKMLANQWWGLTDIAVLCQSVAVGSEAAIQESGSRQKTGLFFTGGVDSFHSLLTFANKIDALVFVSGFDVPLKDHARLDAIQNDLGEVARANQLSLVWVRTNLRENTDFCRLSWNKTHGAALASVGHCLAQRFDQFLIASTDVIGPHGSHPELDARWSSSQVTFVPHGSPASRLQKVAAIVGNPVVESYLRVCWKNRPGRMNCGECEKCVRTQLQFHAIDNEFMLRQQCFPAGNLTQRVRDVPAPPIHLQKQWRDISRKLPAGELKAEVERKLEVSDRDGITRGRQSIRRRLASLWPNRPTVKR